MVSSASGSNANGLGESLRCRRILSEIESAHPLIEILVGIRGHHSDGLSERFVGAFVLSGVVQHQAVGNMIFPIGWIKKQRFFVKTLCVFQIATAEEIVRQ